MIPDFHRRLLARQVNELFRFAPAALVLSFVGSIATVLVFHDTGDLRMGLIWFVYATMVMFYRTVVTCAYRLQSPPVARPGQWARLMIVGNFLAGIQWGLIGTLLYPAEHNYREIFTVLVLALYVAGSIVAFSPVRRAYLALALPASVPPAIFIFFVRDGVDWIGGVLAIVFIAAVLYVSHEHHAAIARRLQAEIDDEDRIAGSPDGNSATGNPRPPAGRPTGNVNGQTLARSNRLATSL